MTYSAIHIGRGGILLLTISSLFKCFPSTVNFQSGIEDNAGSVMLAKVTNTNNETIGVIDIHVKQEDN